MRLEVFCEDRLGLTRELLDLLVLRGIDLRGIDIDPIGRIYLNFAELEFATFSSLMAEIRRIAGVTDVRTVPWMPSEREHLALSALLVAMPEPVLSLDTKGRVELANPASCLLFGQSQAKLRNHPVAQLIADFNVQRWLESSPQETHAEHVVVNGQNYLLEVTPVYLEGEHNERVLTGAVAMLRSTVRMGRQLQTMTSQDTSAFSQILAVGPKMRHVVEQARKLAMLSAPLLIVGDTGTGKDLLAHACHLASPRAGKPYLALNCGSIPEDAVESELFGDALQGKKGFFEQANGGCMIARAINPSVFGVLFNNWALELAILLTTLAISGLTGWLLVRYSALPGATGAWGSSPGGASAMVVMAQEYGADVRLVALMQYLRVLFVVGAAALVVRYALGNEAQEMTQDIVWFPSLTQNFPFTLLLTAVACWLGMRLRIPSGAMLLPMLLGALAQGGGWLMLELPEWLLAMAYAVLGWTVGLQFNKAIFLLALKTLPQIIASIIGLILMCALMALALTHILQMDFMTAYLATSPGGLDTVAIIAAGTRADMSFIMALQTLRLFTILLTGPAMARAISRYAPRQ